MKDNIFYSKVPKSYFLSWERHSMRAERLLSKGSCIFFGSDEVVMEIPKKERPQIPLTFIFLLI